MAPFCSLTAPSGAMLPLTKGGDMASRSREYTRAEADPQGRFRPVPTAEEKAAVAETEAMKRRLENLKYTHDERPMPASDAAKSGFQYIFWVLYFAVPVVGVWLLVQFLDWWRGW